MVDFASIEHRILDFSDTVVSDLEREAHTKIGTVLVSAAKELIDVLPDGPEVEAVIEALVSAATTSHNVVHAAAAAVDPAPAVVPDTSSPAPIEAPVEATSPETAA
jgi:hypothetical protein